MTEARKKAITGVLVLLDSEGFNAFDQIPYRELIKPLVWRDRKAGMSYKQMSIRYEVSTSKIQRLLKSVSASDKENKSGH